MKMLGTLQLVILGLSLSLVACGGGDKAKMEKMKDAMCACKDKECTKQVEKDNEEWLKSLKDKYKSKDDVPKDMMDIGEAMDKCKHEARSGGKGAMEGKMADQLAKMSAFADQVCACADAACATKVNEDMSKAMADSAKGGDVAPTEDEMKKMTDISKRMGDCQMKLMSAPK